MTFKSSFAYNAVTKGKSFMKKLEKMTQEELEQLGNKDIACLLLEEQGPMNTGDVFKKIIEILKLPKNTFDSKIGDFYTSLATDKRFILLDDGCWDLRNHHTSDKVIKIVEEEDDEEESKEEVTTEEDSFDDGDETEDDYDDDTDEELK